MIYVQYHRSQPLLLLGFVFSQKPAKVLKLWQLLSQSGDIDSVPMLVEELQISAYHLISGTKNDVRLPFAS
jgi:hypothetical protein